MLKIYCALSAECTPERVHSTEVPNAALASCVGRVNIMKVHTVMKIILNKSILIWPGAVRMPCWNEQTKGKHT